MSGTPETKYANSGDINIAYQVLGDGPIDIVVVPGLVSHLDLGWELPDYSGWMRQLASFSRVILFDKRGTGLSDRDVGDSTLEERMDDMRAVLDAAGSSRCSVIGISEGGALSILFAATYPDRTDKLVLAGAYACGHETPDFPEGLRQGQIYDEMIQNVDSGGWGQGRTLRYLSPSLPDNPALLQFVGRFERSAASPRAYRKHVEWMKEIDVQPIAKTLLVPTLIIHRTEDWIVPVAMGHWFARNIPNARYVEQPGDCHALWMGDAAGSMDAIREFITGERGEVESDRVLATVLFTDIVGSTERAARVGDAQWRQLLDRHHATVRKELARHRGKEIDTSGDGFFAAFDGPARAVRCATAIRDAVKPLGIEVRAGVHTGECERHGEKLAGIAVHTGARVLSCAGPSEVWVSGTVRDLVAGSGLNFEDRGMRALKGIPGEWRLFAVA